MRPLDRKFKIKIMPWGENLVLDGFKKNTIDQQGIIPNNSMVLQTNVCKMPSVPL